MEKIQIQKNKGDILTAEDFSIVVSCINDIIDYLTTGNTSGGGGGGESGGSTSNIIEQVKAYISLTNYEENSQTPITPYSFTPVGLPWGIWLYSYLESDLINPIKKKLLSESEYSKYLGSGYSISTSVDIQYNSAVFMDEFFREPLQVLTYTGNSTNYSGVNMTRDLYYIKGAPRVWDVFADNKYDAYRNEYESRPKFYDQRTGARMTFYNEGVVFYGNDEHPVVKFTGTLNVKKGDGTSLDPVSKTLHVPIYANRDLVLDNLFCIIPKEICTFEQFSTNPQPYIDLIKQNDYDPIMVAAQTLLDDDIILEYKKAIRAYAISTYGLSESQVANVDSYLAELRAKYSKKRVPLEKVGAEIVVGWFDKYQSGLNVTKDSIDQSYLYTYGWYDDNQSRWTAKLGYYATSVQNITSIPRFNKVYTLDNVMENGDGYFFTKGPIYDTPFAPRFKDGTRHRESVINGTIHARPGDIVVALQNNEYANKNALLYNVMDKTTTGDWYSTLKSPRQMGEVSEATNYVDSVGRVRNWNLGSTNYITTEVAKTTYYANGTPSYIYANEICTIPYEDIIDMDTREIVTSESNSTYARYGGEYTIFAFEVNKEFYIKDTKWGFGMNYPTNEYFDN